MLVFRDSTERLRAQTEIRQLNEQLEQRVQARTEQLTAANRELESFSYSVSHDLRAPLRAISGFSRMLMDRCGTELDDESRRMLGNVCQAASRMGNMVDDFLNLARIGRHRLRLIPVDMNDLVQEVLAELGVANRRPVPTIVVGPLPVTNGDPPLLRQVWINLLANAVKFTGRSATPTIGVKGRLEGNEVIYSVKDNGVGFDMEYSDKLFGTFQRLHSNEEFEGTGVGLAIAQRIVQRHGGRIWADAAVDQGATFHFALPVAPQVSP